MITNHKSKFGILVSVAFGP